MGTPWLDLLRSDFGGKKISAVRDACQACFAGHVDAAPLLVVVSIALTRIDQRGRQPTAPAAAPTDRATPLPPPCADRFRSGHPPARTAAAKSAAAKTEKRNPLSLTAANSGAKLRRESWRGRVPACTPALIKLQRRGSATRNAGKQVTRHRAPAPPSLLSGP